MKQIKAKIDSIVLSGKSKHRAELFIDLEKLADNSGEYPLKLIIDRRRGFSIVNKILHWLEEGKINI